MGYPQGTFKVIEYIIDPSRGCVGEVPDGKVIKAFVGKNASEKANKLADKKNADEPINSDKGYFVKGELMVDGR